ncbi:hypothetical protein KSZ_51260 [Dictyobacter formicarum]|uniref:histidine kinase n=1 Tax=Dictyobacter formicarum TaxID=2778368 RepID=A0ABQ3VMV1_9CHLR|nr:hypothetical protein KSZ_51260 [Dictyobacter formicarum]
MSTTNQTNHLRQILEALPGAVFVLNDTDTIVYANARAQAITRAAPEAFLGTSFWRSVPHLVSSTLYQAVRTSTQRQELTEVEYCSSITHTWLHVQLAPAGGGLLMQFQERKEPTRQQEGVTQGKCLCIDDLDSLQSRIALLTPEGLVLEINAVPFADAHFRREEIIGQPLAEAPWWSFSPRSQEQLHAALKRASRGETVRFETVAQPREGLDRYLDVVITPHRDADHHIAYLVMVGNDITARKRTEAEIHALIDAIPQLVWTARPDGSNDSVNQRYRDYTGLTSEEAQGEGWTECLHLEDRPRVLAAWQRAVRTGEVYETEERLRQHTTGTYHWFLARAVPMRDEAGQIIRWFGTSIDIHEKKQAEEELRVLIDAIPQFVWMMHPDGSSEYGNQRWYDYTGMTPEQTQGDGWLQALHPDDYQRTLSLWRHARLGRTL